MASSVNERLARLEARQLELEETVSDLFELAGVKDEGIEEQAKEQPKGKGK